MMQIDLVGPVQSPVYKYVLSGIDVFSKYLFAVPLTSAHAGTVAKALVSIVFQHSYIPTKILSDLGTSFVAELIHELSKLLEIQLEHASLKHPQTIRVVERSQAALKRILKLNTDEDWTTWYRYVDLATFIHNTSYHSSIGCTPSSLFHGREPFKPIDLRFRSHALAQKELTSDYLVDLQDSLLEQFSHTKLRLLDAYHKYRTYYDKKAAAKPLMQHHYCLLLNSCLLTQIDFAAKSKTIWLSLYRVEKLLTKSIYLIRKVGTPYTQWVQRNRLRPITPNCQVVDIQLTVDDFKPDPSLGKYRSEHEMFDDAQEDLIREGKFYDPNIDKHISKNNNEVEYVIGGAAVVPAAPREDVHLEAQNAVPEEHQYPPLQPAPEPAPLEEVGNQLHPELLQPAAPVQVHFDSLESGVSPKPNPNQEISLTRTELADTQAKPRQSRIPIKSRSAQSTPAASQRIRFDQYDYHRGIPSRQDSAKKGYYAYFEQQATTPPSVDTKRTMLRNIASTTRQKLVKSTPSALNLTRIPRKLILKNRYPIRSNRGQPPSSFDVHSPNFQFNQFSNDFESILLPPKIEFLHGDLFENPHTNFGHCVSSDLVMAAGSSYTFFEIVP